MMIVKWIGAGLIVVGSGAVGLSMAANHRAEIKNLKLLIGALDYMACELQYNLTPLPQLCHQAGKESSGVVREILLEFSSELDSQITPDVSGCMNMVVSSKTRIPSITAQCLKQLGASLGRFDLQGQLKGLEGARAFCRKHIESLEQNKDVRIRSYQTLSLCAGAALAIVLI